METTNDRLRRFLDGPPEEILGTLGASLQMNLMPEIESAVRQRLPALVLLGTHAFIQVIAGKVFDQFGPDGTVFFLREFVDNEVTAFSTIGARLHELRNSVAHQWLAAHVGPVTLDWEMPDGWKLVGADLHVNFELYVRQFAEQFDRRYYRRIHALPEDEAASMKLRALAVWLNLKGPDALAALIKEAPRTGPSVHAYAARVDAALRARFGL